MELSGRQIKFFSFLCFVCVCAVFSINLIIYFIYLIICFLVVIIIAIAAVIIVIAAVLLLLPLLLLLSLLLFLLLCRDIDYNPNKPSTLVTCGDDRLIKFWDTRHLGNGPLKVLEGHSHSVHCVRYNPFHDQLLLRY